MKTINIGGVPEHFNLSWYFTLVNGTYKKNDINLRWKDFKGGTGQMCKALRNEEIDLAVVLTEGIIKDIIDGNDAKIIQIFVKSPLIWGIHVAENSNYKQLSDLENTKAAISRYGSGSHLMAYINAENNGWDTQKLDFELIKNLDGALEGLKEGKGDYFMWEHFTTKPFVDQGIFRRLGDCPTPWPCFVIAVRNSFLEENKDAVTFILETINTMTASFKDIPNIEQTIAERYGQKIEDVKKWLALTEWSQENIDSETINTIQDKLFALGIIDKKLPFDALVHNIN